MGAGTFWRNARLKASFLKKGFRKLNPLIALSKKRGFSKRIFMIFLFSFSFEGAKILNLFILFTAFGIQLPVDELLLLAPCSIFIASLPITVLGLATRESAVVALFALYGSSERLLAIGLSTSFVEGVVPLIVGLFLMKSFFNRFLETQKERIKDEGDPRSATHPSIAG